MGIVMGYFFCTISFVVFVLEVWEESAGVLVSSIITGSLYLLMYVIFASIYKSTYVGILLEMSRLKL